MNEQLDLDELFRLAKEDPDAFEKKRQELITEAINSAPPENQNKLKGIQWSIEVERHKFKGNAEQFASYVLGLTTSKFLELNSSLQAFQKITKPTKPNLVLLPSVDEEEK